ncbi:MAG: dihydrolipoyllysine-residue acetyltransferase [Pseudomonadales bacterium]
MSQDIRIPDIGDADAVEVVEICVAPGDHVTAEDAIIVIESDKASMEVPAGVSGVIREITVAVGDEVTTDQIIARLESGTAAAGGEPDDEEPTASASAPATDAVAAGDTGSRDSRDPAPAAAGDEASKEDVEVRVPDIGDAQGVVVVEVAVAAGDPVEQDDLLVVVESDKASMEIPAPHAGTVKTVHVGEGDEVEEGTLLVTLETAAGVREAPSGTGSTASAAATSSAGSADAGAAASDAADRAAEPSQEDRAVPAAKPSRSEARAVEADSAAAATQQDEGVYAGPAVRRLARELGVALKAVTGSGHRGRIVKEDVKAFVKNRLAAAPAQTTAAAWPRLPAQDFSRFGPIETVALSRIRARGAENLHRSWINVPHVTQHDEVDVTDLEDFRAQLRGEAEKRGVKVTPLAFIVKACVHALQAFPIFNASLDPEAKHMILKGYYHIGIAVDTQEGLVVPVIRDADRKGIWELSAEVVELAEKARAQKLGMTDLQGASFSVTSLGADGGTGFTPIINAPEVAILGVARLAMKPHWNGSEFVPRKMLPLSLSYDHRAINGAEAARFVAFLGALLGDIRRLTL